MVGVLRFSDRKRDASHHRGSILGSVQWLASVPLNRRYALQVGSSYSTKDTVKWIVSYPDPPERKMEGYSPYLSGKYLVSIFDIRGGGEV